MFDTDSDEEEEEDVEEGKMVMMMKRMMMMMPSLHNGTYIHPKWLIDGQTGTAGDFFTDDLRAFEMIDEVVGNTTF